RGPRGYSVRGGQPLRPGLPSVAVDEVVPVGNEIAEWTPLVADRHAAVHAPCRLVAQLSVGIWQIHLVPVVDPLAHRAIRLLLPLDLDKPCGLTHERPRDPRARLE